MLKLCVASDMNLAAGKSALLAYMVGCKCPFLLIKQHLEKFFPYSFKPRVQEFSGQNFAIY